MFLPGGSKYVVVDVGTTTIRAGFAGMDQPSVVESSLMSKNKAGASLFPITESNVFGTDGIEAPLSYASGSGPISVDSEDALETILTSIVTGQALGLPVSADERFSLMVSEPSMQSNKYRELVTQLAFEKLDAPSAFLCKRAVLSAFGVGRPSALVVHAGGGGTNVSAVSGGYIKGHLTLNTRCGGSAVDTMVAEKIKSSPRSNSKLSSEGVDYGSLWKTRLLRMQAYRDDAIVGRLPDGTNVDLKRAHGLRPVFDQAIERVYFEECDLVKSVSEVINRCANSDETVLPAVVGGVVLEGGMMDSDWFAQRVQQELSEKCTAGGSFQYVPFPSAKERKYSAWLGGSILASLGMFYNLTMTKAEYLEQGVNLVSKKCP